MADATSSYIAQACIAKACPGGAQYIVIKSPLQEALERFQHGHDWNPHHLVFCTTTGTAYSMTNWHRQQYQPLLKKAGLPYIRPHDLRHTAATLLLLDKVLAIVVSRMRGHASVAFTLQTYGHVLAEMREEARDVMERRFAHVLGTNPEKSASR